MGAFSATGAIEGQWKIRTGVLVCLSEQQFMDCNGYDYACAGGRMDQAWLWAHNRNLCAESGYAYEAARGSCRQNDCDVGIAGSSTPSPFGSGVIGGMRVRESESALKISLQDQPTSVAIQAYQKGFYLYISGVYTGSCGSDLDHAVLAVGYGEDGGLSYWKLKNSWSDAWGDAGYIRIQRNQTANDGKGMCGIFSDAAFVLVSTSPTPSPAPSNASCPSRTPSPPSTPDCSNKLDILWCHFCWMIVLFLAND